MRKIIMALFLCPLIARGQLQSINLECSHLFSITNASDYLQPVKDNILKLKDNDFSFKEITGKSQTEGNELHETYQQYYKGVPIEFATLQVHFKDGKLNYVSAKYQNVPLDDNIALPERSAFAIAKKQVPADEYIWDVADRNALPPILLQNEFLFPEPHGQLVYFCDPGDQTGKKPVLTYKFQILANKPYIDQYIYIDCATGEVVWQYSLVCQASAQTRYNGTRNICTDNTGSSWRLFENACSSVGGIVHTFNLNHAGGSGAASPSDIAAATEFTDADNNWTAAEYHNSNKDDAALDAQWGAEQTYLYWKNVHGRYSIDGAGLQIKNYVHLGSSIENAFWDHSMQLMEYGDGGPDVDILTTPDDVGHELGHGICQFTAGLPGFGEGGAINEGLSDIWAACIESYAGVGNPWLHADQSILASGKVAARSLANPKASNVIFQGPDTYKGTNWVTVTGCTPSPGNDECGVHTNMSVMSHWFFLLTNGGSGTNDNSDAFLVDGIGIDEAAKIVYKAEKDYMASGDQYSDARAKTIHAARDLYGDCSVEVASVISAWRAVGVGSDYPIGDIINVTSPVTTATSLHALYINGSSAVSGGIYVEYRAVREVNLNPGFQTLGETFLAIVEPCTIVITAKPAANPDQGITTNPIPGADNGDAGITVYPNPTQSSVTISYACKNSGPLQINIEDVSGRTMHTESVSCGEGNTVQQTVDMNYLSPGVYFIKLTLNDRQIVKKIVKL